MSEQQVTRKVYFITYAALLALLGVTVVLSEIDLGDFNIVAALSIAIGKTVLIVLYFMHIRYAEKVTRLFVAAGFFWVCILLSLTIGDYFTRGWPDLSMAPRIAGENADE